MNTIDSRILAGAVGIITVGCALYAYKTYISSVDLLQAATEGNVALIKKFGGGGSVRDEKGNTPLMLAIRHGHVECVGILLSKRADVTTVNVHGFTPLHIAAHYNAPIEIVANLLSHGAKLDAIDPNAWTPLHMAASSGYSQIVLLLIANKSDINAQTLAGQTPLLISSCNGHLSVVRALLDNSADTTIRTKQRLESPLYYATGNQHAEIVDLLVSCNPELLTIGTSDGTLPIHVATSKQDMGMVRLLVDKGGKIGERKKDGTSVLHIAANSDADTIVEDLILLGVPLDGKDSFGCTALHKACTRKSLRVALLLLKNGASVHTRDNDKMTPLHALCSAPIEKNLGPMIDVVLEIFDNLLAHGADINARDNVDSTPLHHAVCRKDNLPLIKKIVEQNIAPAFLADKSARTPLHLVSQMYKYDDIMQYLTETMKKHDPHFFDTYDANKREKIDHNVVHSDLSPEEMRQVLDGDVSLNGIAKKILSGKVKNIVVLTGAGISTNAGIPDFRSPDKGIYTNPSPTLQAKIKISPKEAFTMSCFAQQPDVFYAIIKELFLPVAKGVHKPTLAHRFIALLHQKGLLQRNYTQNIDTLERQAGVPQYKMVEAHGSFASATCERCGLKHLNEGYDSRFWKQIEKEELPTCSRCESAGEKFGRFLLKPDVVLFGEPLPAQFFDSRKEDFEKCDLVIIMGTSLTVFPFASLPNDAKINVPRLLFNGDVVGPFTKGAKETWTEDGKLIKTDAGQRGTYRDVAVIGDIDKGVQELLDLLGWKLN